MCRAHAAAVGKIVLRDIPVPDNDGVFHLLGEREEADLVVDPCGVDAVVACGIHLRSPGNRDSSVSGITLDGLIDRLVLGVVGTIGADGVRVVGEVHRVGVDGCGEVAEGDQVLRVDDAGIGGHASPLKRRAAVGCTLRSVSGEDAGDVCAVCAGCRGTDGGHFVDVGVGAVDPAVVDTGDDAIAGESGVVDGSGCGVDRGILDGVDIDSRSSRAVFVELRCRCRSDPLDSILGRQVDHLSRCRRNHPQAIRHRGSCESFGGQDVCGCRAREIVGEEDGDVECAVGISGVVVGVVVFIDKGEAGVVGQEQVRIDLVFGVEWSDPVDHPVDFVGIEIQLWREPTEDVSAGQKTLTKDPGVLQVFDFQAIGRFAEGDDAVLSGDRCGDVIDQELVLQFLAGPEVTTAEADFLGLELFVGRFGEGDSDGECSDGIVSGVAEVIESDSPAGTSQQVVVGHIVGERQWRVSGCFGIGCGRVGQIVAATSGELGVQVGGRAGPADFDVHGSGGGDIEEFERHVVGLVDFECPGCRLVGFLIEGKCSEVTECAIGVDAETWVSDIDQWRVALE